MQNEPAGWRRGVDALTERDEANTERRQLVEQQNQMAEISAETVQLPADQHIELAPFGILDQCVERGARLPSLTNRVRGWRTLDFGRTLLPEIVAHYRRKPVAVRDPAVLIRINQHYRPNMTPTELYDATRASWKVGPQREQAQYALAVFEGIVREVYEIKQWLPSGSTFNYRFPRGDRRRDRWEFVGRLAEEKTRHRYLDRFVGRYFPRGAQNPIAYVNIR
jgi:hypothetical protein